MAVLCYFQLLIEIRYTVWGSFFALALKIDHLESSRTQKKPLKIRLLIQNKPIYQILPTFYKLQYWDHLCRAVSVGLQYVNSRGQQVILQDGLNSNH